ncbi:General stress protein A, partial [Haemophilus influenzae]
KITLSLFYI